MPLWRTDPLYHELRESHDQQERAHRHWRERYSVAGKDLATRPKRRGQPCQELRAQAALLIEWLCISWREGWLGSARRNSKGTVRDLPFGQQGAKGIRDTRARLGLGLPYGPQAAKHGYGLVEPPSRRGKAPPGADPPDSGEAVPF